MPPEPNPVPRFAAEPPQQPLPAGERAEALRAEFLEACLRIDADGADLGEVLDVRWFPERTWSGRTFVPATARTTTDFEVFGYVSLVPEDEDADYYSWADFTDETADKHPEWRLDVCEEVVGGWRGAGGEVAAMTLVWGVPLVDGAAAATGELGGVTVDQCAVAGGSFTLLAPDAYRETYLEVALWDGVGAELARESLYEDDDA